MLEPRRHPSYFVVAGIDLRARDDAPARACRSSPAARWRRRRRGCKVRRASGRPNRLGFAVPAEWRLSVTAYPGIRAGDALETLLHELVHLHVGRRPGAHAWHGRTFKRTLARAMAEAYGITGVRTRGALHGAYAAAIEARAEPEQLRLAG